jgi:hypothetical protein
MKDLLLFKNDEKTLMDKTNMVKLTTHGCSNEYII